MGADPAGPRLLSPWADGRPLHTQACKIPPRDPRRPRHPWPPQSLTEMSGSTMKRGLRTEQNNLGSRSPACPGVGLDDGNADLRTGVSAIAKRLHHSASSGRRWMTNCWTVVLEPAVAAAASAWAANDQGDEGEQHHRCGRHHYAGGWRTYNGTQRLRRPPERPTARTVSCTAGGGRTLIHPVASVVAQGVGKTC